MTRAHGCKEQRSGVTTQDRRALARKGDQPKDWRATDPKTSGHQPKDWAGRGYFLTLSAPHVFILDFGGYVSEVTRGSGIIAAPYDDVAEVDRYGGTRAGPILRKFVVWQAQRHSFAVGHFKHCSSFV